MNKFIYNNFKGVTLLLYLEWVEVERRGEERGSLEGPNFFFLTLEYVEPLISKTD